MIKLTTIAAIIFSGALLSAQTREALKVFISVDMEGLSAVVAGDEISRSGKDYEMFRKIMTEETNAAIEGALSAGAIEIVVRDSHGSKQNILPDLLNRNAKLLRGHSGTTKNMMDTVDETYDAVMFIGYHAKAGTPDATLEHVSTGNVTDLAVNGVSLPEAGYNALIAGMYNVPVVFAAGDKAFTEQVKDLFGEVETVAVKEGIGAAALCLHPEVAQENIRAGVERSLRNIKNYRPYKLSPPYTMVLKMKDERKVYEAALYPGAKRTGDWEVTFASDDILAVVEAFNKMK